MKINNVSSFLPFLFLFVSASAFAQRAERPVASVESANGDHAQISLENPLEFDVKVVNVRLAFREDDGSQSLYFSQPNWTIDLTSVGSEGASWEGELIFHSETGEAFPGDLDLTDYDRELVAAGVDIVSIATIAEAAMAGREIEPVIEQLHLLRRYVPPVSIASRHFEGELEASGLEVAAWFDFDRLDGLRSQLQDTICEHASQRILDARSNRSRQETYEELVTWIREQANLHLSCMNEEAKLATARMLIAGDRPQDALGFSVRNDDGSIPENWLPIYVEAHLSLAQAALDMNAETFSTFERVLDSLHRVIEMDPENERLVGISRAILPRACTWVDVAAGRGEYDNVLTIMTLLRADWPEDTNVLRVSDLVARSLLESGQRWASRGMYVNARNEFVRGERLFEGIPVWEAERETINHYRALGVLEEARETSDLHTDDGAATRALARLDEALQMYDLSQEEIDEFKAYITQAYVGTATLQMDEFAFPMGADLLRLAEETSPTGRTDAIRVGWLLYAEKRYEKGGVFMRGIDIADAREKLAMAEEVDPARIATVSKQLTVAYYGYRVAIPVSVILFGMFAWFLRVRSKREAKRLEEMDLD